MDMPISSLTRFRELCSQLPEMLAAVELPGELGLERVVQALRDGGGVDVAGVGGSEGPARYFVYALNELDIPACYRPMTAFVQSASRQTRALVLFSQGISPNAQLALEQRSRYSATLLVTSRRAARAYPTLGDRFTELCELDVPSEPTALVRMVGPVLFRILALKLANHLGTKLGRQGPSWHEHWPSLPAAYRSGQARGRELARKLGVQLPQAIVVTEPIVDLVQVEAGRWREALWSAGPPLFDALAFAHGSLQTLEKSGAPVLVITRTGEGHSGLAQRVLACLERAGHAAISAEIALPAPLCSLEVDALLSELLLSHMPKRPELWPGKGCDEPLYALAASEQ